MPGSHFYVKYRVKNQANYLSSEPQINEDNIEIGGLEPNKEYEFRVVAVDGNFETPSAVQIFDTSDTGKFDSYQVTATIMMIFFRRSCCGASR